MRQLAGRFALSVVLAAGPVLLVTPAAVAAPPAGACTNQVEPGIRIPEVPWAQHLLGFERAWTFSRGAGVLVAVIDSGVDVDQPQLHKPGRVLTGYDFLRMKVGAAFDCFGHGTAVASIIAAGSEQGIGFHGIAPDAQILPERITVDESDDANPGPDHITPATFAESIRFAVDQGAKVINISAVYKVDVPAIHAAINYAEDHDVVVVAAAGNDHPQGATDATAIGSGPPAMDPLEYPAAYPGVVGVGDLKMNQDGTVVVADESQRNKSVDIVAPGEDITAPAAFRGYKHWSGTSFATPYVSGTVALVRAAFPKMSAKQVIHRVLATATPAPGDLPDPAYGAGIVNPVAALTDDLGGANPVAKHGAASPPKPDYAHARKVAAIRQRADHADSTVLQLAGFGGALALVVSIIAKGRRRRWTPGRVYLD